MTNLPGPPETDAVKTYLLDLQSALRKAFEEEDGSAAFKADSWRDAGNGEGRLFYLSNGSVFERAGIAFSHVSGPSLPSAASARRPEAAGGAWQAAGVSVVLHPHNPYVPACHANLRFFQATTAAHGSVWWFGGGFDLTPTYGFEEDAAHWHRSARAAVEPFGASLYPRFKAACDEYFLLKHRGETRGIGGLFFDDFDELGFDGSFALVRSIGGAFPLAYRTIAARRKNQPYGDREKNFQLYRRGRYVEFNLLWDRGTRFGLESGGRTESILMSMPPAARWDYDWRPDPGSPEARLSEVFLKPRDWI